MKIKKKEIIKMRKDYRVFFNKKKSKSKRFFYKIAKRKRKIRNFRLLVGALTSNQITRKVPNLIFKERDFLSTHTDIHLNYGSSVLKGNKINKAEKAILNNTSNAYKWWKNGSSVNSRLIGSKLVHPWFFNKIPSVSSLSRGYFYLQSYIFFINPTVNKCNLVNNLIRDLTFRKKSLKILEVIYLI